jgi:hypothetical protein
LAQSKVISIIAGKTAGYQNGWVVAGGSELNRIIDDHLIGATGWSEEGSFAEKNSHSLSLPTKTLFIRAYAP